MPGMMPAQYVQGPGMVPGSYAPAYAGVQPQGQYGGGQAGYTTPAVVGGHTVWMTPPQM